MPLGYVLQVIRPLYVIVECGLHWYLTYLKHHLETFKITKALFDPGVLIKRNGDKLFGLILLQVYSSLGFETYKFLDQ